MKTIAAAFVAVAAMTALPLLPVAAQAKGPEGGMGGGQHVVDTDSSHGNGGGTVRSLDRADDKAGRHGDKGRDKAEAKQAADRDDHGASGQHGKHKGLDKH